MGGVVVALPVPPAELSPAERAHWHELVRCRERAWWRDVERLEGLADYCRAIVDARRIACEIEQSGFLEGDPQTWGQKLEQTWRPLLAMEREVTYRMVEAYERAFE